MSRIEPRNTIRVVMADSAGILAAITLGLTTVTTAGGRMWKKYRIDPGFGASGRNARRDAAENGQANFETCGFLESGCSFGARCVRCGGSGQPNIFTPWPVFRGAEA
jgi:hypothetical protein